MSSIYRDIAQQMESIYHDIARKPLEELSKEELIELLQNIKDEAKSSYISYGVGLGWYEDTEQAEKEFVQEAEDEEEFINDDYPIYRFELTDWIAEQKGLSSTEIVGFLEKETDKAYGVFILKPIQDMQKQSIWLPKSQTVQREEIHSIET